MISRDHLLARNLSHFLTGQRHHSIITTVSADQLDPVITAAALTTRWLCRRRHYHQRLVRSAARWCSRKTTVHTLREREIDIGEGVNVTGHTVAAKTPVCGLHLSGEQSLHERVSVFRVRTPDCRGRAASRGGGQRTRTGRQERIGRRRC